MNKRQFFQLLRKYRRGIATGEERKFIEAYYNLFETAQRSESQLSRKEREALKAGMLNDIWEKIQQAENKQEKIKRLVVYRVRAAAAILILLAAGSMIYFTGNHKQKNEKPVAQDKEKPYKNDIHPGGNKAVLILANGQKMILDKASTGTLVKQGAINISKPDSGELVYGNASANNQDAIEKTLYNTIAIPRGGEYKIVLSDGTKVWLNAESSLRYPVAFNNKERRVALTGEGYFEVAKQNGKPFIVEAGDIKVQVLGTHFNINAYNNEKTIRTTLEEGSVKVFKGNEVSLLKPGEQASLNKQTGTISVKPANVDMELAWKNGLFHFENTNIKTIMREVARWYNVDVVYATSNLDKKNFSGIMSRYSNVSALLKRLELTGTLHFKVEDKKIIVMD